MKGTINGVPGIRSYPFVFFIVLLLFLAFVPTQIISVGAVREIPIGAYYYPWYGSGGLNVGRHWNDSIYTIVVDEPVFYGYYDCLNITHVAKQIRLMANIEIDFVIISWWGNKSYEDNATKVFIEANIAEELPLKFCIMAENYTTPMNYTFVYDYIYENYVALYSSIYFRWQSKPLLCWFSDTNPPKNDTRFTERMVGQNVEGIDWIYYPELGDNRISNDGCITVAPRWDDYYIWLYDGRETYSRHDVNYTEGMYDKEWNFILRNRNKINIVLICSWNEYHERTMIEPHKDISNPNNTYAYDKTQKYIKALHRQQQLLDAATYIANRYDRRIGLVSESEDRGSNVPDGTPCYRTFWVYSDNLWASQALRPFYPQIAENISRSIKPYIAKYGNSQFFEVVLGIRIPTPIHDGRDLKAATYTFNGMNYTVWLDRHMPEDGGVFDDAEEYADLAFYLSLNHYWNCNITASEQWFRIGEAMWENYGFYDKAAKADGRYQNYKLGLYLFTVKATRFISEIYDSVENVAWSYMKENGGIASQSYLNGTIYGTANVETTSALLLAYNEELIDRLHPMVWKDQALDAISETQSKLNRAVNPESSVAKDFFSLANTKFAEAQNAYNNGDYKSAYQLATNASILADLAIAAERSYQALKMNILIAGGFGVAAVVIVIGAVLLRRRGRSTNTSQRGLNSRGTGLKRAGG